MSWKAASIVNGGFMQRKSEEIKWHRLDNTANIFPVINNLQFTGVFRIGAVLHEDIQPQLLDQAVKQVIPHFEAFQVQLRTGIFWYYMETNRHEPCVEEEHHYPCRFFKRYDNQCYLFRTGYFKNKLYVEFFHALTDGFGAIQFMKELTAAYIRLAHPDKFPAPAVFPLENISNVCEDSYLKYYKKQKVKGYKKSKAYQINQPLLDYPQSSVIHGHLKIADLKAAAARWNASITQYLAAVLVYTIYQEYLQHDSKDSSICLNIPVNLRKDFPSETTMNFFSIALAQMLFEKDRTYTFEEVLQLITEDFKRQLDPAWLEKQISYNVSNEKNLLIRLVPLPIKSIGIRLLYNRSAKSFTTTLSNVGIIRMKPEYEPYIQNFHFIMGASESQPVKCVAASYKDEMIFTISSVWQTSHLEYAFFNRLKEDGIEVITEGNGIHRAPKETPYPKSPEKVSLFQLLGHWYVILTLLVGIWLTLYNFSYSHGMKWPLLVDAGILYSWMTLRFSVRFNINPAAKILSHSVSILLICILTDFILGYGGWSLNYGLPTLLITACTSNVFLMLFNTISWQSYFLFQSLYTALALILVPAFCILGLIARPAFSLAALGITMILLAVSALSGPKKIKTEVKRRFHF